MYALCSHIKNKKFWNLRIFSNLSKLYNYYDQSFATFLDQKWIEIDLWTKKILPIKIFRCPLTNTFIVRNKVIRNFIISVRQFSNQVERNLLKN
jgi:hypothetical protein